MAEDTLHRSARGTGQGASPRYEFVVDDPDTDSAEDAHPKFGNRRHRRRARHEQRVLSLFVGILLVLGIFIIGAIIVSNSGGESRDAGAAAPTGTFGEGEFNIQQNWGAYSPYFDSGVPFDGISPLALADEYTLPEKCTYRQVHVLHRHGDRYPAGGTFDKMHKVAEKLQNMDKLPSDSLGWLAGWNFTLGKDILVPRGVGALFESGARFWGTHGRLLYNSSDVTFWHPDVNVFENGTARPKPVLRATTQYRIEDSARAWAAGFFGEFGRPSTSKFSEQYELVLQDEVNGNNNSLAGFFGCPNNWKIQEGKHDNGKKFKKKWVKLYLEDAAKRLQDALPGYDNFSAEDALVFQDLCAFETVAYGKSAFCQLFTKTEWRGFEYHFDLGFYGESGWGSLTGPATGLPWLTELHSRLTNKLLTEPVNGVNVTLDSNPNTFPLDQPFYADFSHDTVIFAILSAMQLDIVKEELSPKKIKVPRQLIISRLTPFGARMYVEVIGCEDHDFARVKLNDRVVPLTGLKYCPENKNGLCPLSDFVKSLEYSLTAVNFDEVCYGDKQLSAPVDDDVEDAASEAQ